MIDIHHHLLPGFDDGAQDLDTSIAMAKIAVEDGITHVVCTPHANNQYVYDLPTVERRIGELQGRLDGEGIALKLGRGCDFHLTFENIQQAKSDPAHFSVNGLGYLLMEIPDYGLPQGLTDTFYQLQLAGLTPILTHPERNPTLQGDDDSRMMHWMRGGVLIQVTAGSVLGQMGRTAQKMAHRLLERRWVHFLATDAHNVSSRAPRMREAHDLIAAKYGSEYAHLLCVSNPLHAFQGKPLVVQPEPAGLYGDAEPESWWKRMFG